jgi:hypothetical protein
MNIIEKIHGAFDSVVGGIKDFIVRKLEPEVLEEISERVKEYQIKTLKELPEQCEAVVKEQSTENAAAWAIYKVLGEDTSELVEKIMESMKPGIDSATDQLNIKATEIVMERVRDALDVDGDSSDEDEIQKPRDTTQSTERAGDEVESISRGIDEVEISETAQENIESSNRGIDEIESAPRAVEDNAIESRKSKKTAKRAKSLKERLPGIEASTRVLAHPLFEKLQIEIQELAHVSIRNVLTCKLDESNTDGNSSSSDEDNDDVTSKDRGFLGHLSDGKKNMKQWFKKTSAPMKEAAIETLINIIDGPINNLIDKEVAELEESSITSAFASIRRQLEKYHLISKDRPEKL